jgi:hypothetical protein
VPACLITINPARRVQLTCVKNDKREISVANINSGSVLLYYNVYPKVSTNVPAYFGKTGRISNTFLNNIIFEHPAALKEFTDN